MEYDTANFEHGCPLTAVISRSAAHMQISFSTVISGLMDVSCQCNEMYNAMNHVSYKQLCKVMKIFGQKQDGWMSELKHTGRM